MNQNSSTGNGKFYLLPSMNFNAAEKRELAEDFKKALITGSGFDKPTIKHILDNAILIGIDDSEDSE